MRHQRLWLRGLSCWRHRASWQRVLGSEVMWYSYPWSGPGPCWHAVSGRLQNILTCRIRLLARWAKMFLVFYLYVLTVFWGFVWLLGIDLLQTVCELIVEISQKWFYVLSWFLRSDQDTTLHTSRQLSCRDVCKIMTWLDKSFFMLQLHNFLQHLENELINSNGIGIG